MGRKRGLTVPERIRDARERAGMEAVELRNELRKKGIELSKQGLHRMETVEPKNPNVQVIEAIADITHVSPGWILFGEGPMVRGEEVGGAIRGRIIDTIELMVGALDLTKGQRRTIKGWLESVRGRSPGRKE